MTILGIAFDFESLCTSTRGEVPDESRSNWHGLRRPPEVLRSDHSMCESFILSQWTWAAGYAEMEREGLQNLTSKNPRSHVARRWEWQRFCVWLLGRNLTVTTEMLLIGGISHKDKMEQRLSPVREDGWVLGFTVALFL